MRSACNWVTLSVVGDILFSLYFDYTAILPFCGGCKKLARCHILTYNLVARSQGDVLMACRPVRNLLDLSARLALVEMQWSVDAKIGNGAYGVLFKVRIATASNVFAAECVHERHFSAQI